MSAHKLTVTDVTKRLDELPTLPVIVYELSKVISDPMSSTADVERLMENDQSLTTKVLKLVNSAYYAIPGGVKNLARAIAYLGFDTVNQLVLSSTIIDSLKCESAVSFDLNEFWKHSMGVAVASETIAKIVHHPMPSDLFTCGLVHDMGKIALLTTQPEAFLQIVELSSRKKITFLEAETQLDIPNHTRVGHMLAQKWILPIQFQSVIKHHHEKDPQRRGNLSNELNQIVDIVLLGNLLTHALKFGSSGHSKIEGAPRDVVQRLNLNPDSDIKKMAIEIRSALERASDFLRVLGGG